MYSGFPAKILEQMILTSLYDVMRVSHATVGGNYKKESMTEPQGCYYCCLGVLTQEFGSFTSHRPSTSAVSVPRVVGSISRMHTLVCFSISMHPDLFGGL